MRAFSGVTLPEQSTFLIYLAVSVCVLPIATQFATYAEPSPSRWGGAVVAVGAVATLVAVLRLQGLWVAGGVDRLPGAGDRDRRRTRAVAVYGIFALSATARAAVQIADKFADAPLAYLLSALAGVVYILATVGLAGTRPGRAPGLGRRRVRADRGAGRRHAHRAGAPRDFPDDTVWSVYGRGYGFVPLVLPLVGLWWLRHTRPR